MVGMTLQQRQILIVEDDAAIRQILRAALEDEGFAVTAVADGPEAIAWFGRRCPDLVLLDIGLPGLNGSTVAARLQHAYGRAVPIVVITAMSPAAEQARAVGAISSFDKPFDLDQLLTRVREVLAGL